MYAIKGTTAKMRCRGFKYELGKTYKMAKKPILCSQGFHACLNPYDVLYHYANNGYNRYFLVDLGGTITDGDIVDTKVAANEITFLKEVSVNDFPDLYEEFRKDKERLAKLYYEDGFAVVNKNGKYNFICHDGKYISKKWFDFVESFFNGFAVVRKGFKFNFIDFDGKYIMQDWFDLAFSFYEGFAKVKKDGKYNFIDKDGNYLCKEWFDRAYSFNEEGHAMIKKGDKWYKLYQDCHLEEYD